MSNIAATAAIATTAALKGATRIVGQNSSHDPKHFNLAYNT